VNGGDGGGVESDHRLFESTQTLLAVLLCQGGKELIGQGLVGRPLEGGDGIGQAGAHAVA
jgi:hypothetical protein